MIDEYQNAAEELGHPPRGKEITENCRHGLAPFDENVESIIAVADHAGLELQTGYTTTLECENCDDEFTSCIARVKQDRRQSQV